MQYTVREVGNDREFKLFYQFQNRLYRDCPTYVPSLDSDQRHTLSPSLAASPFSVSSLHNASLPAHSSRRHLTDASNPRFLSA